MIAFTYLFIDITDTLCVLAGANVSDAGTGGGGDDGTGFMDITETLVLGLSDGSQCLEETCGYE